jgi:hypothetical protein
VSGETFLASQSTIVYADFDNAGPFTSSTVARSIAQAAKDSLTAGQFNVGLKPLSAGDVKHAVEKFSCGHDRLSPDNNLILLDAEAMLAYAPYRATILLSDDPFESVERIQESLGFDADFIRLRLHDALLTSNKIVSLNRPAHEAIASLVTETPQRLKIPSTALRAGGDAVLVVGNVDDRLSQEMHDSLRDSFPAQEFVAFDASIAFERAWKFVLQIGIARSSFPGARLADAWAGGLPLLQFVDAGALAIHRRRHPKQYGDVVIEHGKTGLLCSTERELKTLLSELFVDILPASAVARGAKRRADPAGEWDDLLKAVLQ